MAGAFGFEAEHYDVSIACGERVLLPAVRQAGKDTLIIADGFSCREQVSQCTDRVPLHIAEVLKMATDHGPRGVAGNYPERRFITPEPPATSPVKAAAVAAGLGALGLATLYWIARKRDR